MYHLVVSCYSKAYIGKSIGIVGLATYQSHFSHIVYSLVLGVCVCARARVCVFFLFFVFWLLLFGCVPIYWAWQDFNVCVLCASEKHVAFQNWFESLGWISRLETYLSTYANLVLADASASAFFLFLFMYAWRFWIASLCALAKPKWWSALCECVVRWWVCLEWCHHWRVG